MGVTVVYFHDHQAHSKIWPLSQPSSSSVLTNIYSTHFDKQSQPPELWSLLWYEQIGSICNGYRRFYGSIADSIQDRGMGSFLSKHPDERRVVTIEWAQIDLQDDPTGLCSHSVLYFTFDDGSIWQMDYGKYRSGFVKVTSNPGQTFAMAYSDSNDLHHEITLAQLKHFYPTVVERMKQLGGYNLLLRDCHSFAKGVYNALVVARKEEDWEPDTIKRAVAHGLTLFVSELFWYVRAETCTGSLNARAETLILLDGM